MKDGLYLWAGANAKISLLEEMTNRAGLTMAEREAVAFGLVAVQFGMRPATLEQFTQYIKHYPYEISAEEEAKLARMLSTPARTAGKKKKRS